MTSATQTTRCKQLLKFTLTLLQLDDVKKPTDSDWSVSIHSKVKVHIACVWSTVVSRESQITKIKQQFVTTREFNIKIPASL